MFKWKFNPDHIFSCAHSVNVTTNDVPITVKIGGSFDLFCAVNDLDVTRCGFSTPYRRERYDFDNE